MPNEPQTEALPVIRPADRAEDTQETITDEEAYAKLKAKRAERRRKKLIKRGIIAGIAAAVVLIAVVATLVITNQPAEEQAPLIEQVEEGTFTTTVDAKGSLKPLSSSVVSPACDGTIESISVTTGQQVSVGDVLMTIKNDELDRAVADAQRTLAGAQEDLVAAKKAYSDAASAPQTVDEEGNAVKVDLSSQQGAVSSAQRAVESAQAALDQANAKAQERTVAAETSGSIVDLNAKVGAAVSGGMVMGEGDSTSGKQCMQVADLSQMKVTIQVGESDIAKVAVGQTANITYPAFDDVVSTGTVTSIASVASGTSGDGSGVSFDVDILIAEPDQRLKPGMTAQVSVVTEQLDNVITVPATALATDDGVNYHVNLATDETGEHTRRVNVTVVTKNDDQAVVGKSSTQTDEAGNEINPGVPLTKLRAGDLLVSSISSSGGGDDLEAGAL